MSVEPRIVPKDPVIRSLPGTVGMEIRHRFYVWRVELLDGEPKHAYRRWSPVANSGEWDVERADVPADVLREMAAGLKESYTADHLKLARAAVKETRRT